MKCYYKTIYTVISILYIKVSVLKNLTERIDIKMEYRCLQFASGRVMRRRFHFFFSLCFSIFSKLCSNGYFIITKFK